MEKLQYRGTPLRRALRLRSVETLELAELRSAGRARAPVPTWALLEVAQITETIPAQLTYLHSGQAATVSALVPSK